MSWTAAVMPPRCPGLSAGGMSIEMYIVGRARLTPQHAVKQSHRVRKGSIREDGLSAEVSLPDGLQPLLVILVVHVPVHAGAF